MAVPEYDFFFLLSRHLLQMIRFPKDLARLQRKNQAVNVYVKAALH